MDVLIESPDYEIDMKAGLETLQGISEATRCVAETLITGKVPQRKSYRSSVRTNLKKTFKGSYGQIFSLEITNEDQRQKFRKIGNGTFVELFSFFMKESLYLESAKLSKKAEAIIEGLGDNAEQLVKQLRVSAMADAHRISKAFNQSVTIRHRKSIQEKPHIAKFDRKTVMALEAREKEQTVEITAGITRLNIHTGNGRLLLKGHEETVAFGFGIGYKEVALDAKKKFSENLDRNNGINNDAWEYLSITATPIRQRDGKIVKYIVRAYRD
ncbi:hypothetical protein [Stutzerimonas balearica]|uniref:hypothetical protein n=1 Tax=Stutzerimonas balearica TaxID=74829 RepID=UPI0028A6F9A9|nr:hypothetical protein [Stutzerimonas balearica]